MILHPRFQLGLALNQLRVDDLEMGEPMTLDFQLEELCFREDIHPLLVVMGAMPKVLILQMKVGLPVFRVFVRIESPGIDVEGPKGLLDFNQRATAASLDKITPPVVLLCPDDLDELFENLGVRP